MKDNSHGDSPTVRALATATVPEVGNCLNFKHCRVVVANTPGHSAHDANLNMTGSAAAAGGDSDDDCSNGPPAPARPARLRAWVTQAGDCVATGASRAEFPGFASFRVPLADSKVEEHRWKA